MKKLCPLIIVLFFFSSNFAQKIKQADLKTHLFYLASDSLKGRETGTEGQKMAAEYIAEEFRKAGLQPFNKSNSNYFQEFNLYQSEAAFGYLFTDKDSFFVNYISKDKPRLSGLEYMIVPDIQSIPNSFPVNTAAVIRPESLNELNETAQRLSEKNCKTVFVITEPKSLRPLLKRYKQSLRANDIIKEDKGESFKTIEKLSAKTGFIFIPESDFQQILKINSEEQSEMFNSETNESFHLSLKNSFTARKDTVIATENVLGCIEGVNKDEYIVITAHYDHIGESSQGINYGADDNASGTAALIELAKAFSELESKPERTVVFVAFSAEELGLLGSKYFTQSDIFKVEKCILNINMDMIGKSIKYNVITAIAGREKDSFREDTTQREDYVYVNGYGNHTKKLIRKSKKQARKKYDFKVDRTPGLLVRLIYKRASDHYHFAEKGVPVLVFFTGLHPDYHTPRDTPDKIDYENLSIISNIIYDLINESLKI